MSEYWICDTCGEKIENAKDGWVEWITVTDGDDKEGRDLRLVHHMPASPRKQPPGCQHDESSEFAEDRGILSDMSLEDFLGPNGLMRFLVFIHKDELPKDDVLEMIKRLFIPGYEVARFHFDKAMYEGVFEPNNPNHYHFQDQIEATLEYVEENLGE